MGQALIMLRCGTGDADGEAPATIDGKPKTYNGFTLYMSKMLGDKVRESQAV